MPCASGDACAPEGDAASSLDGAGEAASEGSTAEGGVADATIERAVDAAVADSLPGADVTADATALVGVRLANWSPDAPSVDLCLAPHGSQAFRGPLVAPAVVAAQEAGLGLGDGGCAGTPGVCFPQASSYRLMQGGSYDARIVAAGSPGCSIGLLPDLVLPALGATSPLATVALLGKANPSSAGEAALRAIAFSDDVASPPSVSCPVVTSISASPSNALVGDSIALMAAASNPGLTITWSVGGAGVLLGGSAGSTATAQCVADGTMNAVAAVVTVGTSCRSSQRSVSVACFGDASVNQTRSDASVGNSIDSGAVSTAQLALRFIHAAPSAGSVDLFETSPEHKRLLPSSVAFSRTSAGADGGGYIVDSNGYVSSGTLTPAGLSALLSAMDGGAPLATAPGAWTAQNAAGMTWALRASTVVTVVLVASPGAGGAAQLVECLDSAGVNGPYASCAVISQ